MSLRPGSRLGSYEIVALLGAGGMGEVYKAKDLKLERTVAIKVLREELASDPERLKRFELEARSASALDHPNIVTIHDIAEVDGRHFIVMQYVEGKTVRELVARGPLSLGKTLHYAIQIADGLSRAHRRGIAHRDLKPDNVMVTEEGLVKILDFGLAKLTEPSDWTEASTRDLAQPQTKEGHIVGTAPYMSPEQGQGKKVDARSDIFSFGSVLYEMVTGRRAFGGDSIVSVLAAIVRDEPEKVSVVVPSVPVNLERVIRRALRKEPERRFQSMADMRLELLEIQEEVDSGCSLSAERLLTLGERRGGKWWVWAAAVAVIVGAGAAGWLYTSRPVPTAPPRVVPFTAFEGMERDPAFSPDGSQIAFVWREREDGHSHLYVKLVGEGEPLQLTDAAADDYEPAWSPDGRRIAFLRMFPPQGGSEILEIPALGGQERRWGTTATRRGAQFWNPGLDYSPDGKLLAVSDTSSPEEPEGIFLLSRETGEKRRLTSPPSGRRDKQPAFSPDGKTLAFIRGFGAYQIYLQPTEGGEATLLTEFDGTILDLDWVADGSALVFSAGRGAKMYGLRRIATGGGQADLLPFGQKNADSVSVAMEGDRMVYSELAYGDCDIWRVGGPASETADPPTRLIYSTVVDWSQEYSPDGTKIAFTSARSGVNNVWVCDSEGAHCEQLTHMAGRSVYPRWSPDGESIAFRNEQEGKRVLYVMNVETAVSRRLVAVSHGSHSWSHDGRRIYFNSRRSGKNQIYKIPVEGGEPAQITQGGGWRPRESGDGKFVYYTREGTRPIWRVPADGGEETLVLEDLEDRMFWILWRGKIVYTYGADGGKLSIRLFDPETGKITQVASLQRANCPGFSVSPDGQWVLYSRADPPQTDITLVENFH